MSQTDVAVHGERRNLIDTLRRTLATCTTETEIVQMLYSELGVPVHHAYPNEVTRDQALRHSALNAVARALSGVHDLEGVVRALHSTLAPMVPVETLELVVREDGPAGHFRLLTLNPDEVFQSVKLSRQSERLGPVRGVLRSGRSALKRGNGLEPRRRSQAWLPILEQAEVLGVLSVQSSEADAYEASTIAFLEHVADEVSVALRNAWSYAALEAQRRRLEVANVVGRKLASSRDSWSIVLTLREELSRHLEFDLFSLATVEHGSQGPTALAHVCAANEERQLAPVSLTAAGSAREAYEQGRPILARRSRRAAARSVVWVPVLQGDQVTALLSLQSARVDAFDDWQVSLLEDVAAQASLALATADHFNAAQNERRRLEALHVLETGAAGAADERQVAEALFAAMVGPMDASYLALTYLGAEGHLTGYARAPSGQAKPLAPRPVERTNYFKRLIDERLTISEATPSDLQLARPVAGWQVGGTRVPKQVLWVPLFQGERVIGAISAQRHDDRPFGMPEVQLLESAAPVVAIMLRTVRLHRANEMALMHSVRVQEVAALAGHDLDQVVASVADQARNMLGSAGAACWAFDGDGRVTSHAATGRSAARSVLTWSGRSAARSWREPPSGVLNGIRGGLEWTLIPLWYGDRLVGALGSVRLPGGIDPLLERPADFERHAAIAIENSRLVAETRGRIRTLEAVARFASLDIALPERARSQMSRLVERALSGSMGMLWLLEGDEMVCQAAGGAGRRLPAGRLRGLVGGGSRPPVRSVRRVLRPISADGIGVFATPIVVADQMVGMLTADAGTSAGETRRLMTVLAGQAALVLGRLQLVGELNQQARMMGTILAHSPLGVVLEDAAGNALYANPEVERVYGVEATAITGRPARHLLDQAGAVVLADSESTGSGPLELRLPQRGTVVQVRRVPIPGSEEQPARVLTLHEDITQEHLVLEAKDLMLRAIGHEVRSPATAMRGMMAGLLTWGELIDLQRRRVLVEEAYEQSERLVNLVESQLVISKLETQSFEPNPGPVSLRTLLHSVLRSLRQRYGSRVESVTIDLEEGLADARCEQTHLDQVLTNLIGNALEYTQGGAVRVSGILRGDSLEVAVADQGGGLPAELRQTLFHKTGPAGRNRSRGGLGLGLYLCRLVVERSFGGRIWLAETGPAGTVFKFTVPAEPGTRSTDALPALRAAR